MWWNHQINLNNYNKFVKLLLFFDYFQEWRKLTTILKVIMIKKGCDNEIGITIFIFQIEIVLILIKEVEYLNSKMMKRLKIKILNKLNLLIILLISQPSQPSQKEKFLDEIATLAIKCLNTAINIDDLSKI